MAYNEKVYGIISTDSADNTAVAAPTRDDYYPTMYEVKKEIGKEIDNSTETIVNEAVDGAVEEVTSMLGIDEVSTTSPATLEPNVFYNFGEATTVNVTLAPEIEDKYSEYMFEFKSGATATVLTVPDTVKWVTEPNIEANKTYQVSILNNIGLIVGV